MQGTEIGYYSLGSNLNLISALSAPICKLFMIKFIFSCCVSGILWLQSRHCVTGKLSKSLIINLKKSIFLLKWGEINTSLSMSQKQSERLLALFSCALIVKLHPTQSDKTKGEKAI